MTHETVAKAPCKTCPYRRDVPSGVWAAHEYDRLPAFDGEPVEQFVKGGTFLFGCHQNDGHLCAGWVATHGAQNLVALRLRAERIDPSVWSYTSPVPVFSSGQEACDHGKQDIENPSDAAVRAVTRLSRKVRLRRR